MVSTRRSATPRAADPIDKHVGRRIRMQRMLLGMTQEKLADGLDLGVQQLQKYERGANRISAGRLEQIARALHVPVGFFFEATPDQPEAELPVNQTGARQGRAGPSEAMQRTFVDEFLADPDGPRLAEVFSRVKQPALKQRIVQLVEAIADSEKGRRARPK